MEERILSWIQQRSTPLLDSLFVLSHELGTGGFCTLLVVVAAAVAMLRNKRREALLWVVLGLSTYLLQKGIKVAVGRPRPELWPHLVDVSAPAFPSGHALAAATFYPLLGRAAARRWPKLKGLAYASAVLIAVYVGIGRLYLGVHWPSDVLAGWAIGAFQTIAAVKLVDRFERRQEMRDCDPGAP